MLGAVEFLGNTLSIKQWCGEYIGHTVAFDTETTIAPFYETPDFVLGAAYGGGDTVWMVPQNLLGYFFIRHKHSHLVFQNAPFDVDVVKKRFPNTDFYPFYDNEQLWDVGVLYRLYILATGGEVPRKYSLALIAKSLLGIELSKEDSPRMDYGEYKGREYKEFPLTHLQYAALDVLSTFSSFLKLKVLIQPLDRHRTWLSHHIQVKGDLALLHIHKNGIGFDLDRAALWLQDFSKNIQPVKDRLATWGWVRGMKGLSARYELIMNYIGIGPLLPRTADGSMSSAYDDLLPYSKNLFISDFLLFQELEKAASFVKDIDRTRLYPRYTLLVNTGRTSCSGPNVQQLPRKGGIRELFVPTLGSTFLDIDYSSIELAGLAQVCYTLFGHSLMRELINEGRCLHYHTASSVYNKPIELITKEERQFSKIPNFGFAANMSPETFVEYCGGYGVDITLARARQVKEAWVRTYPEMREFFRTGNGVNHYTLTGRRRANCTYTAFLNTSFQGLCADGLKLALYDLDKKGFKITTEVHDQILLEVSKEQAEEMLPIAQEIMVSSMNKVIPDVMVKTEGKVVDRWCK